MSLQSATGFHLPPTVSHQITASGQVTFVN